MRGCRVSPERGQTLSAQRNDDSWQVKAACRGPQAAVFFPPPVFERKDEKGERESRAKEICRSCGVRKDCLEYALSIREPHGIWGGLNEVERKNLMVQRVG
jgi:WhiB family redox-sensing transcriptional regulator